jgi:hypothetical protein
MASSDRDPSSVNGLRRTLVFLAKSTVVGSALAVTIAIATLEDGQSILSETSVQIVASPLLLVSFVGATFIFPVGWFKTLKWWLKMPRRFSSKAGFLDRSFFPFSVVLRAGILEDPETPSRQNFIDALKWLGAGCVLILIVVSLANTLFEM